MSLSIMLLKGKYSNNIETWVTSIGFLVVLILLVCGRLSKLVKSDLHAFRVCKQGTDQAAHRVNCKYSII